MQLTLHADYAFRVLLYLASQPAGRVVPTGEISRFYRISQHHLVRVIQTLNENGFIEVSAGRSGGAVLASKPEQINLGDVVRKVESNLRIVECFDPVTNTCPIIAFCGLKPVLAEALDGFLQVLDRYSLADLLKGASGTRLRKSTALPLKG